MESFATAYPVIFNDGEEDHDKGHIGLHSVLNFKKFQAQLSRVVGLPANQLSTVFMCTIKDTSKRQKLPIGESTNFNIILNQHHPSRERDCHFLVSIKKSKKERKGGRKKNAEVDDDDSTSSRGDVSPLEQRPKQQQQLLQGGEEKIVEKTFPESTSPTSILQRPLSPVVSSPEDAGIHQDANSETRKVGFDKILLRRDSQQIQQLQAAATGGAAGSTVVQQRVEGFSLPRPTPVSPPVPPQQFGTVEPPRLASRVVINNAPQQQQSVVRGQRFNDAVIRGSAVPYLSAQKVATTTAWLNVNGNGNRTSVAAQQPQRVVPLVKRCKLCQDSGYQRDFHYCVDDAIFEGFRNCLPPAGPIQRIKVSK